MTPRSTVILSTLAGFFAGAALVGGLALQPERGQDQDPRPDERQPEDRPRPNPGRPRDGQGPRNARGEGRPVMDRERLLRRLDELTKRLDTERDSVGKLVTALKAGEPLDKLETQIREVMMIAGGRQFRNDNGGNNPPGPPKDDRQELHNVLKEADPALADRIEEFQKQRPIANMILANLAPKPQDVLRARKDNPELFDLHREQISCGLDVADRAFELLELRKTNEPDSEPVKAKRAQLREAVGRSFDLRGRLQEHDLESLVKRVEDLRSRAQAAAADREKNIDVLVERISRMLEDIGRRGGKPGEPPPPGDNPPPEGRRPKDGPRPNPPPR